MRKVFVSLALAAALAVPFSAQAQLPFSFGIAGGPNFSVTADELGFHVGALMDIDLLLMPVGFRVDGMMNQFKTSAGSNRIFNVTGNVVYTPLPTPAAKPYFIGGVGFYSSRIKDSPALAQDNIGVNAGAGVKLNLLALKVFVDARYHYVFNSGDAFSFIPVSVGIMF